jgi:hypothetical protein
VHYHEPQHYGREAMLQSLEEANITTSAFQMRVTAAAREDEIENLN